MSKINCITIFHSEPDVHPSSKEGFVHVLRRLTKGASPRFLPDLAEAMKGRQRNHLARCFEDVYPFVRTWDNHVVELIPGWFIGTNWSDSDKEKQLDRACRLRGKTYGRGADVWVLWEATVVNRRSAG